MGLPRGKQTQYTVEFLDALTHTKTLNSRKPFKIIWGRLQGQNQLLEQLFCKICDALNVLNCLK